MTVRPVLDVENLRVELAESRTDIVDEISLRIAAGEVLGLVGESGSGKSTVGVAMLGHCRRGARIAGGEVRIDGVNILRKPREELRRLRGNVVSYVPQDPPTTLNPALRIETQLMETLSAHGYGGSSKERRRRVREMLEEVLLPGDGPFLRRYPHQLSGGQQQRIVLAMAFACRPRIIVLDEPTTGLDVTTQAHVLRTVRDLCRTYGVAALYISHDLAVVAELADRIAVMYAGRLVEGGPERELFLTAAHPYTRRLIRAIPDISGRYALIGIAGRAPAPGHRPKGCSFAPRCELAVERCTLAAPPVTRVAAGRMVRCYRAEDVLDEGLEKRIHVVASYVKRARPGSLLSICGIDAFHGTHKVLHDVSLELWPHECLGLVGESGSGKTTLAHCIAGLHRQFTGEVLFRGNELARGARERDRETRRVIQYIFQSPYSSLNPRRTVGELVAQPLKVFFDRRRRDARAGVLEALDKVALSHTLVDCYPAKLSGGEQQRVAIARAIAAEPELLVCDEITSALDVSVQAAIVELLMELQQELGVGLLFITHNLALMRTIGHEVAVMREGRIIEFGKADVVLTSPRAPYTRKLLFDTPSLDLALVTADDEGT